MVCGSWLLTKKNPSNSRCLWVLTTKTTFPLEFLSPYILQALCMRVWSQGGQFSHPLFCHSHPHPHERLESVRRSEPGRTAGRGPEQRDEETRSREGYKEGRRLNAAGDRRKLRTNTGWVRRQWGQLEGDFFFFCFFPFPSVCCIGSCACKRYWKILKVQNNRSSSLPQKTPPQ